MDNIIGLKMHKNLDKKRGLAINCIWLKVISLIFILLPTLTYPLGDTAWVVRYNGSGNCNDLPVRVFVDTCGNAFIVGKSNGIDSYADICLIKYDSLGKQQWVRTYNGPNNSEDIPVATIMDDSGNIYIAGITMIPALTPDSYKTRDFLLLKYNSAGQQIWVKTYGEVSFADILYCLNIDSNQNIYICGACYTSQDSSEIYIIKYKPDGNIVWKRRYGSSGYVGFWGSEVHILGNDEIYLVINGEHPTRRDDWIIMKISSQGVVQWEKIYKYSGEKVEDLYDSKIDEMGNIYITGKVINDSGNSDFCTMKIDSSGNILWLNQYNGPENLRDNAYIIIIDRGNVYVAGVSMVKELGEYWASCVIKYDSTGRELWVRRKIYPSTNGDYQLKSVITDEEANLYVTGRCQPDDTLYYATIIKYDSLGNEVWIENYKPAGNNSYAEGQGVVFDNQNNMYLYGIVGTAGVNKDILIIKYRGR